MIRRIIHIDEEKCNGCGACAAACHESAIGMVDGKAKLLRDDYCDGLGDCLPSCPTGAITFVEREAAAYDEEAVLANQRKKEAQNKAAYHLKGGCPGRQLKLRQQQRWSLSFSSGRYRSSLCRHRLRILKGQNCLSRRTVLPMPMQIFIRILSEERLF